ncbi:MAG: hypothetical protein IJX23_02150 [Clostridia bacterium]|nr:hypothetical protein [Clostridia bacterium]
MKNTQKLTLLLILALLIIISVFTFSACDEPSKACQHQWIEANCLYPKTCRICYQTEGSALGHNFYNATCTEPKTCTSCNLKEGAALGHSYTSVVQAPTCTKQGYTTHTCSACGDTKVDTYVESNGHTVVIDNAVSATCTRAGLTEGKHCSICNVVLVKQGRVDALGHDYVQGECTICGDDDPNYTNPYDALAQYVLDNGTYNGEGWYFIEYDILDDGNEYQFCIFTDDIATSLSFVMYSYVADSDSYVEIYLNKDTDIQDVYIWNESSGHTTNAYGSIYENTFGYSNYIYDYEYYGDYSSLSSKFKEVFQSQVDLLLTGVSTFLLPDHITMEMLGFVNY